MTAMSWRLGYPTSDKTAIQGFTAKEPFGTCDALALITMTTQTTIKSTIIEIHRDARGWAWRTVTDGAEDSGLLEGHAGEDTLDGVEAVELAIEACEGFCYLTDDTEIHVYWRGDRHPYVMRYGRVAVTDGQIEALRAGAGAVGDLAQVRLCDAAIAGNIRARAACIEVLNEADARASEGE